MKRIQVFVLISFMLDRSHLRIAASYSVNLVTNRKHLLGSLIVLSSSVLRHAFVESHADVLTDFGVVHITVPEPALTMSSE